MINSSQTCQNESGLVKILNTEDLRRMKNVIVLRISPIVKKKATF